MPSSLTTAIPTGTIDTWCLGALQFYDGSRQGCASEKNGFDPSDFQTFCCDGEIINVAKDIWMPLTKEDRAMNLSDLVCCGVHGPQAGGVLPVNTVHTQCVEGEPTPLASIAGTNTDNAVLYRVTYTSASFGQSTTADFIPTNTPVCLWAYTSGVGTKVITLPAPEITAPPPATTDKFGNPISTTRPISSTSGSESTSTPDTTVLSGTAAQGSSETSGAPTPSETPSGAASVRTSIRKGCVYLGLGLVTLSLLWS